MRRPGLQVEIEPRLFDLGIRTGGTSPGWIQSLEIHQTRIEALLSEERHKILREFQDVMI